MAKKICGIYRIINGYNDKVYIGQSHDIKRRVQDQMRYLKKGCHRNKRLQNAYSKYGEYFDFEIIEECPETDLDKREMYWIGFYHSDDRECGYNIMAGGQVNRPFPEKSRYLMSKPVLCIETGVVYLSVADAQKATGIGNISGACNGKMRHAGKLHWCFCEDATEENIQRILNRPRKLPNKRVVCVETGDVFDSLQEAAEAYGVSVSAVSASCNHYHNQYKKKSSYHWEFYKEVIT